MRYSHLTNLDRHQRVNDMKTIKSTAVLLIAGMIMVGCGGNSTETSNTENPSSGRNDGETEVMEGIEGESGSNIPYLRKNHDRYTELGSDMTPSPVKSETSMSIAWTISGKSEENALMLADHIRFMISRLEAGMNPRAWDKLFLMEAYMKVNHLYTTEVERSGTTVVISKRAAHPCAYAVISAHSDAVSGDFFARGDIMQNYSSIAEKILSSSACSDLKTSIDTYISQRLKSRR
jgi:hypothetical protein